MDAFNPTRPQDSNIYRYTTESSNQENADDTTPRNSGDFGRPARDTRDGRLREYSEYIEYFDEQVSTEVPEINSYRLSYPVPGINVRVLNSSRPSGTRSNDRASAPSRGTPEEFDDEDDSDAFDDNWHSYSRGEVRRRAMEFSRPSPPLYADEMSILSHTSEPVPIIGSAPAYRVTSQGPLNTPAPSRAETHNVLDEEPTPYPQADTRSDQSPRERPITQSRTPNTASGGSRNRSHSHGHGHRSRRHVRYMFGPGLHRPSLPTIGESSLFPFPSRRREELAREMSQQVISDIDMESIDSLRTGRTNIPHRRQSQPEPGEGLPNELPPPPRGFDDRSNGRPEPKESEELLVNLECKACMTQLVDTVMLPCGHAVLCRWCAEQLMPPSLTDRNRPRGTAFCPMCRSQVKHRFRIFLP